MSIKLLSHKAWSLGAGDWEQSPTRAPVIDSVKRLINVECYVAEGHKSLTTAQMDDGKTACDGLPCF